MATKLSPKIWLLAFVPNYRYGRWIAAATIAGLGFGLFWVTVFLAFRDSPPGARFGGWPTAAFFVAAVAYIVPVFHYITTRTEQALATLLPHVAVAERDQFTGSINRRSLGWAVRTVIAGVALWLGQSRVLAGSWSAMWDSLTASFLGFLMAVGPLPVWLTMCASMSALFQNALTFRQLSLKLDVDILEPDSYMPIGSMAVTSTLVVLGRRLCRRSCGLMAQ